MTSSPPQAAPSLLPEKILAAFDLACEQRDLEVAEHLHHALELLVSKPPAPGDLTHRRAVEASIAAYDRLLALKQG